VNAWLVCAAAMLVALVPCAWVCARRPPLEGLVALELAGTVGTLVLMLLAEGFDRSVYWSVALVAAPLQFVGGLAFVRLLIRGLV
jgi:multisubunit Na+/H+ antiporter MnhF subunit